MTGHIFEEGVNAEYICDMTQLIKNATLNFLAKFLWSITQDRLSPTLADNIVTWDLACDASFNDGWAQDIFLPNSDCRES